MSQVINHTALFKGLVYYLLPSSKILQRDSRFNDSINKQINESIDKPNFCFFSNPGEIYMLDNDLLMNI